MKSNKISFVIGVLIIAAGFASMQFLKSLKNPPEKKKGISTQRAVLIKKVSPEKNKVPITIRGKVVAGEKINIYSEVTGILLEGGKDFKEGSFFRKGSVLLRINANEFRNNLRSQKSQYISNFTKVLPDIMIDYPENSSKWENYVENLSVNKSIPSIPEADDPQIKNFLNGRGLYNSYYSIKSAEERLSKHTILAPFDGYVVSSSADPGVLVSPAQQLGTFMRANDYELKTSVSVSESKLINIGDSLVLHSPDFSGKWIGTVKRIGQSLDPSIQRLNIYLTVKGENLKEGLYLNGKLEGKAFENSTIIKRQLLIDEKFLFVVEKDSILSKKHISVLATYEDRALVKGLKKGEVIVNEQFSGARQGLTVKTREAK